MTSLAAEWVGLWAEPQPLTQHESFSTKLSFCFALCEISISFSAFFLLPLLANEPVDRQILSYRSPRHCCPNPEQNQQGGGLRGRCQGEEGHDQERPGELGQHCGIHLLTHEGYAQPERERGRERERERERARELNLILC